MARRLLPPPIRAAARPRWPAAVLVAVVATLAPAGVAAADPARPTDFESRILSVRPTLPDGVSLRVIGGDSFLQLTVDRGHTAVVPDYGDNRSAPAYLRFEADGTVRRNEASSAAASNGSRYGTTRPAADRVGTETWKVVSRNGTYAWHDHRIHWMSPSTPGLMAGSRRVQLGSPDGTWQVPVVVDGTLVTVRGELLLLPAPNALPWFALAAVAAVAVGAAAFVAVRRHRPPPHRVFAAVLVAAAGLATLAGWAEWRAIPADAGGTPITAAVPAVGILAALVAAVLPRPRVQLPALAAAVAALAGWAVWRRTVLTKAVLPTTLPAVDRVATAVALGLAIGVAAVLVWRPPAAPRPVASPDPG